MITIMQERPPYVRFELAPMEFRDNGGNVHVRDVERVLVTPAGSKDVHIANAEFWVSEKERLARDVPPQYNPVWAQQFRAGLEMFRKGNAVPESGTSIRSWPVASPSEVKRCLDANVLTVEDLAQANEQALQRLGMGAYQLKEKARGWIAERDGPGQAVQQVEALRVENTDLRRRLSDMEATLHRMSETIAAAPKRRGKREAPAPEHDDEDAIA